MDTLTSHTLHLIKSCPVCKTKFGEAQISIVEKDEGQKATVLLSCQSCKSSLLAKVVEMPFGILGTASLTDIQANEAKKFVEGEKVNFNDVLDLYK
jgi:uncharacterized protein YbaR (Trm112 family)